MPWGLGGSETEVLWGWKSTLSNLVALAGPSGPAQHASHSPGSARPVSLAWRPDHGARVRQWKQGGVHSPSRGRGFYCVPRGRQGRRTLSVPTSTLGAYAPSSPGAGVAPSRPRSPPSQSPLFVSDLDRPSPAPFPSPFFLLPMNNSRVTHAQARDGAGRGGFGVTMRTLSTTHNNSRERLPL